MRFAQFLKSEESRRRYWARATVGYGRVAAAAPNLAHRALAALEDTGALSGVITQNVDGLHQAAGSDVVVELHGALARVVCLGCGAVSSRARLQARLRALNPDFDPNSQGFAPDGDADVDDTARFVVPDCEICSGALKPDVVFFGEDVPKPRVEQAFSLVDDAELLLVCGTSLAVQSGLRFVRRAAERKFPVVIVNRGPTRGDPFATVTVDDDVVRALPALAATRGVRV